MEPQNVNIRVHGLYSRQGAILNGTIQSKADSIRTEVSLESDEPSERVSQLIKLAEASCFTIAALREPTPVELVTTVNGEPFALTQD